jgi:uncharacterized protein YndB with AHSA1/START domain
MENNTANTVTVNTTIGAPAEKVWQYFTTPEHITQWNKASDEWHTPSVENDLKVGGGFVYRMEARDKSFGFDFSGVYTDIQPNRLIAYTMVDGRKVTIQFTAKGDTTEVVETFDAEEDNPIDLQRTGWQAILDSFKKHVENN